MAAQGEQLTLDKLADKDILTIDDVRYLHDQWPISNADLAAANLATRVERAPQYCRFMTFERLNLLKLYKLQHKILTYGQSPRSRQISPEPQVLPVASPATSSFRSREEETTASPAVPLSSGPATRTLIPSTARPSSQVQSSTPMSSSQSMSSSQPRPKDGRPPHDGLESMGIFDGQLDLEIEGLLHDALRIFKEMQSWTRATGESTAIARSDFAFHFREERYVWSRESMYDLSPTNGPIETDGVRKWLIQKLPLKYVNPAAWNLRRTRQDRGAKKRYTFLPKQVRKWFKLKDEMRSKKGGVEGDDNVFDISERARLQRSATSASLRETREITPFVDNVARILVSVTAGLFLLVPMIVLSFIKSQRARLGTTVAFVVVFSVALGRFSKATNDALMGAAAAYAAVLVVFVGQTTPIS